MGFKEDASFAGFVTMGAIGTAAVARDLRTRFGHRPIELERYSMANKVWAVKVKRLRIPDLLCLRCGQRVESRAKTKLEVKLSDSETEGREWHASGMRAEDLYAFVRVDVSASPPAAEHPGCFSRAGLEAAATLARRGARKAASQGSEVDVSWPAWVPTTDGTVVGVRDGAVQFRTADGKVKEYWQSRKWPAVHLYVPPGEGFKARETIVAGVVPPPEHLACPGAVWDFRSDLAAADEIDRYAAVKAAGAEMASDVVPALTAMARDEGQDWRLRLEAMASLARIEPARWVPPIGEIAADLTRSLPEQMEAIFILSEIPAPQAAQMLAPVTAPTPGRHEEVRCAAIWGMGHHPGGDPDCLLPLLADPIDRVAIHASAAVSSLSPDAVCTLRDGLRSGDKRIAAISAATLRDQRQIDALVEEASTTGTGRLWALRALGDLTRAEVEAAAGPLLTPALLDALLPMWIEHEDWLRTGDNEGAFRTLNEQQIRFDPTDPE